MDKDELLLFIGTKVKNIRKIKGITQEKLALDCHLDLSYYNHFENGKKNISIKNLLLISKILDINIYEILPNKEELIINNDVIDIKP